MLEKLDSQMMPFSQEEINKVYKETVQFCNDQVLKNLSMICSVPAMVELREEAERRIRRNFKEIEE
jgi:hypothetical protein